MPLTLRVGSEAIPEARGFLSSFSGVGFGSSSLETSCLSRRAQSRQKKEFFFTFTQHRIVSGVRNLGVVEQQVQPEPEGIWEQEYALLFSVLGLWRSVNSHFRFINPKHGCRELLCSQNV